MSEAISPVESVQVRRTDVRITAAERKRPLARAIKSQGDAGSASDATPNSVWYTAGSDFWYGYMFATRSK
jgi:hypothetical protein